MIDLAAGLLPLLIIFISKTLKWYHIPIQAHLQQARAFYSSWLV